MAEFFGSDSDSDPGSVFEESSRVQSGQMFQPLLRCVSSTDSVPDAKVVATNCGKINYVNTTNVHVYCGSEPTSTKRGVSSSASSNRVSRSGSDATGPATPAEDCLMQDIPHWYAESYVSDCDTEEMLCCSVEPDECTKPAFIYCKNCDVYMCEQCEKPHRFSKYNKKHQTSPVKQSSTRHRLKSCSNHSHMHLDIYCKDCCLAICATCCHDAHRNHRHTELSSKMVIFASKLNEMLAQTDSCIWIVDKAIQETQVQANEARTDVEVLKTRILDRYRAISRLAGQDGLEHEKKQHLIEIDKAHKHIQELIADTMEKQQTIKAIFYSIKQEGQRVKKEGTSDYSIGNLMPLFNTLEQEASKLPPPEIKFGLHVKLKEWERKGKSRNVQLMMCNQKGGCRPSKMHTTILECQGDVHGMVSFLNHLITVHYLNDTIYVYNEDGMLESSVRVPGMVNPWGLNLVNVKGTAGQLVISDLSGQCLWWLRVEKKGGVIKLGMPQRHTLGYYPWGATTDGSGNNVLVVDHDTSVLHMYSHVADKGKLLQLPDKVKPWAVAVDPEGGVVICNMSYKLMRVSDAADQVTCHYTCYQPNVHPNDMAHDGVDRWLVVDSAKHCVHMITREGKYISHFLMEQHGIKKPTRICVDVNRRRVWLAHRGCNNKVQVMEVQCRLQPVKTLTLCSTLPVIHTQNV